MLSTILRFTRGSLQVPQQTNGYDCALHAFHSAKTFMENSKTWLDLRKVFDLVHVY